MERCSKNWKMADDFVQVLADTHEIAYFMDWLGAWLVLDDLHLYWVDLECTVANDKAQLNLKKGQNINTLDWATVKKNSKYHIHMLNVSLPGQVEDENVIQ